MEYLIKYSPHTRGTEQLIYNETGDVLLAISEKLDSSSRKEVVRDGEGQIVYTIDSFEKSGHNQSTLLNAASKEILTVFLNDTYSGPDLHITSPDNMYAATHKMDLSTVHLYKNGEVIATIKLNQTLFGTNYALDIKPQKDDAFVHLFAIMTTKLLEDTVAEPNVSAYAY